MSERRVAVLLLTNEGFRQFDGGVARYIHNILDARDAAATVAAGYGVTVDWHVAERGVWIGTDEEQFRWAIDRYVRPGSVRYHSMVDPRTDGWMDHFEHCVATGAAVGQVVVDIADTADSVLVVGGMTIFAMAARFVIRACDQFGIRATYVHMTHEPVLRPNGDAELPGTYADSVLGHLARADDRVQVGWESDWMRRQYQQVFGLPDGKLLFARAGVPTDDPKFQRREPAEVERILRSVGVPTDRDLVLSWGRGAEQKGFGLLIDAARAASATAGVDLTPVVANPRHNPDLDAYVRRVGSPAVLLHGHGDDVLSALCQWPRTVCAAFLSDVEAASVTPVEAALMGGPGGLVVVVVPTGVYPELVDDGQDGLIAREREVGAVARTLVTAARMAPQQRYRVGRAAHERARREHDFRTNWLCSFDEMLGRHLAVTDEVIHKEQ